MKAKITNTSRALQGVHTTGGLQNIEPGQTRELDVADSYVERVKRLPFLTAVWAEPVAPAPAKVEKRPLPDNLDELKRDELDALAAERGVDITEAKNKGDVIAALQLSAE